MFKVAPIVISTPPSRISPFSSLFGNSVSFNVLSVFDGICVWEDLTFVGRMFLQLLFPLAVLFFNVFLGILHLAIQRVFPSFTRKWATLSLQTLGTSRYAFASLNTMLLSYALIITVGIRLLYCISVSDEDVCLDSLFLTPKVLFDQGEVVCYTSWQRGVFVFFFFILVPFPYVVNLFRSKLRREEKDSPELRTFRFSVAEASVNVVERFGTHPLTVLLEGPFRVGREYWESILLVRRLIIVVVWAATPQMPFVRSFLLAVLCALFLAMHIYAQPFKLRSAQLIETFFLSTLALIAVIDIRSAVHAATGFTPSFGLEKETSDSINSLLSLLFVAPGATCLVVVLYSVSTWAVMS